jgi:hypothetical protein
MQMVHNKWNIDISFFIGIKRRNCLMIFLAVLRIEPRAVLGKHSTTWATPPALWIVFEIGFCWPRTWAPPAFDSQEAGVIGMCHHAQLWEAEFLTKSINCLMANSEQFYICF